MRVKGELTWNGGDSGPAFIHANYSVMNNDCLFSYGGMFFCFCPNACVWVCGVGSKFEANVIGSALMTPHPHPHPPP